MEAFSSALIAFQLDIYRELTKNSTENVFMSPLSAILALTTVYNGARGKSAEEMKQAMHLIQMEPSKLHQSWQKFLEEVLENPHSKCELNVANGGFVQQDLSLEEDYLLLNKKNYKVSFAPCDFTADVEAARQTINDWVLVQTKDKIKDLIGEGSISSLTRLVLVSAIYFKGKWANQFEKENTHEGKFHLMNGEETNVQFMSLTHSLPYGFSQELGAEVLELPYLGEELSMIVLLPEKTDGLFELEKKLSCDMLKNVTKELHKTTVEVYLPKFKIEYMQKLTEPLQALGMREIFTDGADLSGMSKDSRLHLSSVIHKAFIEINEEGTEAAAATGAVISLMCMNPQFMANRPFLFVIRHNASSAPMFMGRFVRP